MSRLRLAIHLESAAIAPQTSELIEAAKEAEAEIERLRAALEEISRVHPRSWTTDRARAALGLPSDRPNLANEQKSGVEMTTALKAMMECDSDILAAKRFADQMLHLLRDYIPEASRRDAWELLAKTAHDEKFELTTWAMRKQYEAWKETQLEGLNFGVGQLREDGEN